MANKEQVLKLLEQKYTEKKKYVAIGIDKKIIEVVNELKAHEEELANEIEKEFCGDKVYYPSCGGSVQFKLSANRDAYRSANRMVFEDHISIELMDKIEKLRKKKDSMIYKIESEYDHLKISITIEGLSPKVALIVKEFVNFGWAKNWDGWDVK